MKLTCKAHLATINAMIASLTITALVTDGANADGFASDNVELYSHMPLSSFGNPSNGNDCWGYVSDSGREYALMCVSNSMAVVEITDPSNPVIIGSVSHTDTLWGDVKVFEDYCYVVNDGGSGGMDVIDLSNVDSGVVTLVQRFTGGGLSTSHNVVIDEASGFLYLVGANINGGRLIAYSLGNPANPIFAGQVNSAQGDYVHDAQVVTFTEGPNAGKQIAFAANGGTGLDIYDVTNKANMFRLSRTTYSNLSYAHQIWITDDGQYAYLNDELDGINRTVIFDVSDLTDPIVVGSVNSGVDSTDHNQYLHDGFIFEAEYTAGVRIFCAEDPVNPVQVGWFDTYPENDSAGFDGAWSVYPFFPSGTLIVSDINRGLFVLDPSAALSAGALAFAYPDDRPDMIDPQGGTAVQVEVAASCGTTVEPDTAMLHYNIGDGFVDVPMELVSENLYDAVFPAIDCGLAVSYYMSAQSANGATFTDPPNAPATTFSALSAVDVLIALEDDLETDTNWIVGGPGDDATTGVWTRVDPNGTAAQPEDDHTPDPGLLCFVTGQGPPGGGVGENDVDNGQTTLISRVFDVADEPSAIIGYWRWYSNNQGASPNADIFVIDISNDDGSTWTNVETIGPAGTGTSGGWLHHSFSVSDFVEPTSEVRMRFIASDEGDGSIVEAAIDDLDISTVVCDKPVVGDIDGDGTVGLSDLLILLAAWGPCADCDDCPSDLDGDCTVGLSDLLILLANWG